MQATCVLMHADGDVEPMRESFETSMSLESLRAAMLRVKAGIHATSHFSVEREGDAMFVGGTKPSATGIVYTLTLGWEVFDIGEVRFKELIVTLRPAQDDVPSELSRGKPADREWWFNRG